MQIVYFSASWCAPCKSFAPIFQQVMDEHQAVSYQKVDIDENFEMARQFGVKNIPCIVALDDSGKEKGRIASGGVTKANLTNLLN